MRASYQILRGQVKLGTGGQRRGQAVQASWIAASRVGGVRCQER
uniref:Uncharacterized protein n=1 Tax=Arundo donax TaxID=35708 RepID=A0A0A8Y5K8_ARUDO